MARPIKLGASKAEGMTLKDGDWVHTIEPQIIAWLGPSEDNPSTITNRHRVEGRLLLFSARTAWIETNLRHRLDDKHTIYKHTVYAENVPMHNIAPGPLPPRHNTPKRPVKL